MTSKIKVDNINKVSDDSNIIKKCGTTTTIGSGASNPIVVDGSAITLGRCGGTVALASGATQTGFGRTGTVDWNTTPKTTGTFTAVSGDGFFCNTSGGVITANLPAGVAGAIVSFADYAGTWQTNSLTVVPDGSDKIAGSAGNVILSTEGQSVTLVFVDSTQGWVTTADSSENVGPNPFIVATVSGACNTLVTAPCCANVKIATFTGPGNFIVSQAATCATNNVVSHLVVAGGGGTAGDGGGGGGAGGFREVRSPTSSYTASPLDGYPSAPNRVTVSAQSYPITIGGGGTASGGPVGGNGNPAVFSTIVSTGGGGGGGPGAANGDNGGSGGGGRSNVSANGGTGNTPPVSPPQGNNGGGTNGSNPPPCNVGGGGGGAIAAGQGGGGPQTGDGGAGTTTSINGTPTAFAGGGGGGANGSPGSPSGGTGGGGNGGAPGGGGTAGTDNTGGGGGGSAGPGGPPVGTTGGSGIVIIRYKFQ